jgi:phospholipid transport system substrate-binding protein
MKLKAISTGYTIAAAVFGVLFSAQVALAGDPPATAAVRKANTEMTTLLTQKVAAGSAAEKALATKVTAAVRALIDVDELGKAALVNHWSKISAAEQTEYLSLLRTVIEGEYIKGLRANVAYTVSFKGEAAQGADTVVQTEIAATRKGRPFKISVDYVVRKVGGSLRAYDIKTDGVSLVDNYRAQFDKLMAKGGISNLLSKMRKKAGTAT